MPAIDVLWNVSTNAETLWTILSARWRITHSTTKRAEPNALTSLGGNQFDAVHLTGLKLELRSPGEVVSLRTASPAV
jgi:hypothetical protein